MTPSLRDDEEIPFVPAYDLLGALSEEEAAAIGTALALLLGGESSGSVWSSVALLEGISNRI